ncbi:MAG: hypothetical protein PHE73_02715 [Sulfurovaceae bacterium]|nr:hypothetical protein [Sulfurovaceae bacterium]
MRSFFYSTIFLLYFSIVIYLAAVIPISPNEATSFYTSSDLVSILMHWGNNLIGGLIGLRFVFLMSGFISILLFYVLANDMLGDKKDALFATTIFAMLPGIITASILANIAILVLPCLIIYLIAHYRKWYILETLALIALFLLHDASIILFTAIALYGAINKEKRTLFLGLAFVVILLIFDRGIEIGGIPRGHFVEIFAIYAFLFSPFIFLYFMYVVYHIWVAGNKSIIWYISSISLFFSLLLSIRQRIVITDFAPYLLIGTILMVQVYYQSLRIRLSTFQSIYKRGLSISLAVLIFIILLIISQQLIFSVTNSLKFNFASKVYGPYLLSKQLKASDIHCYNSKKTKEQYQLMYYGINPCNK